MVTMVAPSSLERMLESIKMRDEQPKGIPPALPARPTLKGRLPSSRRPFHIQLKPNTGLLMKDSKKIEEELGFKGENFGGRSFEKVEETTYDKLPESESFGERMDKADDLVSPAAAPSPLEVLPDDKLELGNMTDSVLQKIVAADGAQNRSLQGIILIQKHFRGIQAFRIFQELKKGVVILQSFIRSERARHDFLIQEHVRQITLKTFHEEQKNVIHLQSVIRGWLARRHFMIQKSMEMPKTDHVKLDSDQSNLQKTKDTGEDCLKLCLPVVLELQSRVIQAEAAVKQKEEENIMLQLQLQDYETRWSEYEAKMKPMEELLGKRLISLEMSLVAKRKSLDSEGGRHSSSDSLFDSEESTTTDIFSPESETKIKQPCAFDAGSSGNSDGTNSTVGLLAEEFKQRAHIFMDDAGHLIEENSGKSNSTMKPHEELQKLKTRFTVWKKEFNVRLREGKAALRKLDHRKSGEQCKRWWSKRWWSFSCVK